MWVVDMKLLMKHVNNMVILERTWENNARKLTMVKVNNIF